MTTMHLHDTHPGCSAISRGTARPGASHLFHTAVATLRQWRRRIRERQQLAALGDLMLRDIGLTRADAEYLANKPFWRE